MSEVRRRWLAVAGTMAARIAAMAAGIGGSVITARLLGAEGRGKYYAAVTLAGIVAQFANLGLSSSNTLLGARDPAAVGRLMTNSLWLAAACGLVVAVAVLSGGERLASAIGVDPGLLVLAVPLAPAMLFVSLAASLLVAEQRFAAVNGWQIANAALALAVLASCAWAGLGVRAFLLGTALVALTIAAGMGYTLGAGRARLVGFDRALFSQGFGFALRAYVAVLVGYLLQRSGATALIAAGDPHALGVFSIAAQIFDVMIILPATVSLVLFPALVRQQASAWRATRAALRVVIPSMLAASALAALSGRWLIPFVFGRPFAASFAPMLGLLPAVLSISIVSVLSQFLVVRRFPRALVALWIVGAGVAVLAAFPAVRLWGALGAAWAQSAGSLVVLVGVVAMTVRKVRREARGQHDE